MAMLDLQLRKGVRAILSRHWIDPDKIQVMVSQFNIRLSGEIRCLPGDGRRSIDLSAAHQILQELGRLPGVKRVQAQDLSLESSDGLRRPVCV